NTASAISGLETEKRSIGRSKLISLDWPTRTFTAIGSFALAKEALYAVSWPLATDTVASTSAIGTKKPLSLFLRLVRMMVCIIITPYVWGIVSGCDPLKTQIIVSGRRVS